jgi:hypothetical protein
MNDDDGNIYYHPERYGLEILCVEDNGAAWEFDMIVVFRALNGGALYVAHDAGCSCPTPFENYMGVADMTPVRTVEDLDRFLETIGTSTIGVPEALALRRAVVEALGGARRTPPSSTDSVTVNEPAWTGEYEDRVDAGEVDPG